MAICAVRSRGRSHCCMAVPALYHPACMIWSGRVKAVLVFLPTGVFSMALSAIPDRGVPNVRVLMTDHAVAIHIRIPVSLVIECHIRHALCLKCNYSNVCGYYMSISRGIVPAATAAASCHYRNSHSQRQQFNKMKEISHFDPLNHIIRYMALCYLKELY